MVNISKVTVILLFNFAHESGLDFKKFRELSESIAFNV